MKWIKVCLLMGFFFGPFVQAGTSFHVSTECLSRLAEGNNRMGVKLPKPALKKLALEIARRQAELQADPVALLVDYTKNSKEKRAYMVDFKSCDILTSDYVMHGGAYYLPHNPVPQLDGDPEFDGMLHSCKNKKGTDTNMTRPGLYVTHGCHKSKKTHFTSLEGDCKGITLFGLEKSNQDAYVSGVVLHELTDMPNDHSIKPMGQGCPTFAPGHLKALLRYGLMRQTLVLVYAPQCH